jgi:23S rRNA pseudouridine1911/1915/1917 synthase
MRPPPEPEPIDIAVLYEDEWLIAIDKPPGMVVHPTYKNWSGTLLNGLLGRLQAPPGGTPGLQGDIDPRIVTRLDKDTSGIVVVALGADIHARVQKDLTTRKVKKQYLAVVRGVPQPERGTIALPLARSAADRRLVVIDPAGQECRTEYEVVAAANGFAAVRCELVTGRTHQIRVHLASSGWPILGDSVYGEPYEGLTRQALHAWRVTLPHPVSREPLEIRSNIPPDLQRLLDDQNLML